MEPPVEPAGQDLPDDLVLTVEEVAAFLKLDVQTVRALARSGELPAVKLGKQWRFLRPRLIEALEPRAATPVIESADAARRRTISQREAADLLGVTVRTIARMVRDGRLDTASSATGVERLSRESVLRYLGAPASAPVRGVGEEWSTATTRP